MNKNYSNKDILDLLLGPVEKWNQWRSENKVTKRGDSQKK